MNLKYIFTLLTKFDVTRLLSAELMKVDSFVFTDKPKDERNTVQVPGISKKATGSSV
jgi:hypothetical protein